MRREPDFDQLIGSDVPAEERDRLRRAHDLLVRAAPPPELSPELDLVPWPDESQQPFTKPVHRRPLLIAAAIATLVGGGFILGQATAPSSTSLSTERVVRLAGTNLDPNATGKLIWIRSRRAARTAARVSGRRTSSAMTTPTKEGGEAHGGHAGLDRGRLDLGQADDSHEGEQQETEAGQRLAFARRIGVLVLEERSVVGDREEEVAVADGLGRDEHRIERERCHGGERQCGGGELRPRGTRREGRHDHRQTSRAWSPWRALRRCPRR